MDEYFGGIHRGLLRLTSDLNKMIDDAKKKKENPDVEVEERTLTSLQRVTTLREDVDAVESANENPEATFVSDTIVGLFNR